MKVNNIPKYLLHIVGVRRNEDFGFAMLTRLGTWLCPGYRFTWPTLEWFQSEPLIECLQKFGEQRGFNTHRRYALFELMKLVDAVPGDTAECGVYKGCSSYLMLLRVMESGQHRTHHVFDSFEGLSQPERIDGGHWSINDLSVPEETVRRNLDGLGAIEFHKGWIPARFDEVSERRFAAVHVDVDLFQPTMDSLSFFYDRINPGGIFVCDDYGFSTCPGATKAIDDFLADKPERMIGLAGGGGFFIKANAVGKGA